MPPPHHLGPDFGSMHDRQSPSIFPQQPRESVLSLNGISDRKTPPNFSAHHRESGLPSTGFSRSDSPLNDVEALSPQSRPSKDIYLTDLKSPGKDNCSKTSSLFQPYLDVDKK